MTPDERTALRQAIEARIAELADEITSLEESTRPVAPDVAIGRLSRMDAIVNKSVTEDGLVTARNTLVSLKRALQSVDDDDFGDCEDCLKPIAPARLLAMPETLLCVACASARED